MAVSHFVRIDLGDIYVSLIFTDDAEPADPDAGPAAAQRKRRQWLALALSVVALLIVAALAAGVIYAVSIDRAVNGNLQHNSDQLPPETPTAKERRPARQRPQGLLSTTC